MPSAALWLRPRRRAPGVHGRGPGGGGLHRKRCRERRACPALIGRSRAPPSWSWTVHFRTSMPLRPSWSLLTSTVPPRSKLEHAGIRDCIAKPVAAQELVHRATALINLVYTTRETTRKREPGKTCTRGICCPIRGTNNPADSSMSRVTFSVRFSGRRQITRRRQRVRPSPRSGADPVYSAAGRTLHGRGCGTKDR